MKKADLVGILRNLIGEGIFDPDELAAKARKRIPAKSYPQVVLWALREFARIELHSCRRVGTSSVTVDEAQTASNRWTRTNNAIPFWNARTKQYQDVRTMTEQDCRDAASYYTTLAGTCQDRARSLNRLADTLIKRKVATVGELPPDVVHRILSSKKVERKEAVA